MIFAMFIHLFSALLLNAYRRPREMTWLSGAGLLGLSLAFGFTGYLLPWNELAYFATRVGTEIPGVVPVIGPFLRRLLRGGNEVTGATLTRFYGIHVAILPALVTVVLGLHLFLVQKHGMSRPPSGRRRRGEAIDAFFPEFLFCAIWSDGSVPSACSRLWRLISQRSWVRRPTHSSRRPSASSPNGISWRCFKR